MRVNGRCLLTPIGQDYTRDAVDADRSSAAGATAAHARRRAMMRCHDVEKRRWREAIRVRSLRRRMIEAGRSPPISRRR